MTPQLEAAIAAIQPLSSTERQQLLQILIQHELPNSLSNLEAVSNEFWKDVSLQQLRTSQTPTVFQGLKSLAADFWPPEEPIEDFLSFLQEQRKEVI